MEYPMVFVQQAEIAGAEVVLRPAREGDIPGIVTYIQAMTPEERRMRYLSTVSSDALVTPHRLTRLYGESLDYVGHMAMIVVAADGSILGVAHAFGPCDHERGRYECSYSRRIDHRGRGVGTLLMKGILAWGKAMHLQGFWADTLCENLRMRKLFESFGFARVFPHPEGEFTLARYRYDFSSTLQPLDREGGTS
jgi:RimJ/RimL family protein N-acetyltransferase